jgi:hypothetical protein
MNWAVHASARITPFLMAMSMSPPWSGPLPTALLG